MAGLIKGLVRQKKIQKEEGHEPYNSANNFMFFGNGGKSALSAALSLYTDEPILIISPSGSAADMEYQYENVIAYQVDNLDELNAILEDINQEFQDAKKLQNIVSSNDTDRLAKAKEVYESKGEDWNEIIKMAKEKKLPISGVVLEECNVISHWVFQKCVDELGMDVQLGEEKGKLGSDWHHLKKELMELYIKVLKFPGFTILATGDREPGEKQNLKQTTADFCTGAAQRAIIDLVGNVLNVYNSKGVYGVKLLADTKTFAKNKIKQIYSKKELPSDIDLTGRPEAFWELFFEFRDEKLNPKQAEKPNMENLKLEVSDDGDVTKANAEPDAKVEVSVKKVAPVPAKAGVAPVKKAAAIAPAKKAIEPKKK